jgi:hypothetical protein
MLKQTIAGTTVYPLSAVVDGAVGAFAPYCMGYMNPGASGGGYIATMKLSVDKVDMSGLDIGTGGIYLTTDVRKMMLTSAKSTWGRHHHSAV